MPPVLCPIGFPCADLLHARYVLAPPVVDPGAIHVALVAEAPAADPADDLWAPGEPFFWQTTRQALADAGVVVATPGELAALGIYHTTAVKCAKTGYAVAKESLRACASAVLADELAQFPNLRAIVLMGDVAIQAVNHLARQATGKAAIPSGSTYKLRGPAYCWGEVRLFPSYLATGKSFLIEKSKRGMIAEDLRAALNV